MRYRPRFLFRLALLVFFVGLACNPISSLTNVVAKPSATVVTAQPTATALVSNVQGSAGKSPAVATRPPSPVPTVAPTPGERTVHVNALNVREGPPASGGTNSVDVRVRTITPNGDLHVGFVETGVGAIGPQWHDAGWEAVLIASMMLGVDPTNYEFDFTNEGFIDGPSAGCLMTVAVLAALRGDTPRPDATMTGTIDPDGTVGPVGGIPHKMHGAADIGKKLVLVPIGQRYDMDLNTKQMVDVVAEGQQLGMDVREVGNVYDAYQLIVGKPLPRPAVTSTAPQFPSRAFDRIKTVEGAWYTRYSQERTRFNNFKSATQKSFASSSQFADQLAAKSIKDLNQGLVGLAYFEITDAVSSIRQTNADATVTEQYQSGGFNAALNYLESIASVENDLGVEAKQIQSQQPKTVSDVVGLFDAYSNLGAAEGTLLGVENRISTLKTNMAKMTNDQILDQLLSIGDDMTSASNYIQIVKDELDFESGFGTTGVPSVNLIYGVANTLSNAGDANIAVFESTSLPDLSQAFNESTDQVKNLLFENDGDYRVAVLSTRGEGVLYSSMANGLPKAAMVFGSAQNTYAYSSGLIAKYYSLGGHLDKNFNVTSFENDKALVAMLDFADERVKELVSLDGDDVPIPAILYYENAHALRLGSPNDQMTALNYYWQAVVLAQAEAYLTGKLSMR